MYICQLLGYRVSGLSVVASVGSIQPLRPAVHHIPSPKVHGGPAWHTATQVVPVEERLGIETIHPDEGGDPDSLPMGEGGQPEHSPHRWRSAIGGPYNILDQHPHTVLRRHWLGRN